MTVALICLTAFLAVAAAARFVLFVIVRRHAFALWVLVNTCSPASLLFALLYAAGLLTAACFASGILFFYGAGGLLHFGWPRRRAVLIPQITHVAMVCCCALLFAQAHEPRHVIAWLAGLACCFAAFPLQRRALLRRTDVPALLQDPVLGPTFAQLLRNR